MITRFAEPIKENLKGRFREGKTHLEDLAREAPWTTIAIMMATGAVEIFAEATNQRALLCKLLALSSDRWYTVATYWLIHDFPGHARENIILWAPAGPFIEARIGTKWFATTCITVTIGMGIIILIAKGETLTGVSTGKGLSIIGQMAIVLAARPWIAGIIGSLPNDYLSAARAWIARRSSKLAEVWLSNEAFLRLAMLGTYIVLALYEIGAEQKLAEIPVSTIGHIGGITAGFCIAVIAIRTGKFDVKRRTAPIWKASAWPITVTLISFALIAASLASVPRV